MTLAAAKEIQMVFFLGGGGGGGVRGFRVWGLGFRV